MLHGVRAFWSAGLAGVVALSTLAVACSSTDESPAPAPACASEPIDRLKELLVVDEGVMTDARSKNATSGPWSFRYVMETLAANEADAPRFTRAWLDQWANVKEVNGAPVDRAEEPARADEMKRLVVCPWLKRTPDNACDDTCSACKTERLDLAKAPFRIIAIANRIDLRDELVGAPSGEGRFVFGLTDGAADDPASGPLSMTIVVEYVLPSTRSTKEWAETWHQLGRFAAHDESYRAALEGVTRSFASRGTRTGAVNGSELGQIRTNESALNWVWQLREFALGTDGNLKLRPARNTPIATLNNTPALRDHVIANRESILANKYEMPAFMRTGSADQLLGVWKVPDVDEPLRKAFAVGTCNGCHSTERPNVDTAFHVSPFRKGTEKLSPFLYDPRGGADELTTRAASMRRALCAP